MAQSRRPMQAPASLPTAGLMGDLEPTDDILASQALAAESAESSSAEEGSPRTCEAEASTQTAAVDRVHDNHVRTMNDNVQVFNGEWDDEGVFFYQAFKDDIADWALAHQRFGGPSFNPSRMTWIKPSFAWVLYRSGYAYKHNQTRILKVKLPHDAVAELLSKCQCREGGGGSKGRVQWDPARDLMTSDGKVPRELLRDRAIQIGLKGSLSELYVQRVVCIQDVTELAHKVCSAHKAKSKVVMSELLPELPVERPYMPNCSDTVLVRLKMLPGDRTISACAHKSKRHR